MSQSNTRKSFRSPVLVGIGALLAYMGVDLLWQQVVPLPPEVLEVDDGVVALERGNPHTIVLGSSHARSFVPLRDMLVEHGQEAVVVPAEWGTFTGYRAVLFDRLQPLIDERDEHGKLVRDRLARVLLITTFYDMCEISDQNVNNVPARVWAYRHFFADVTADGFNDFNRNFVQTKWRQMLSGSLLVQDRGYGRIVRGVKEVVSPADAEEVRQLRIIRAQEKMKEQFGYCDDARQKQELQKTIDYLLARNLEVTIVLFPLMPAIVTQQARDTTLIRYRRYVDELARKHPLRIADLTFNTPLGNGDFMEDMDHATRAANVKFSKWAVEHDLAYLKTNLPPPQSRVELAGERVPREDRL